MAEHGMQNVVTCVGCGGNLCRFGYCNVWCGNTYHPHHYSYYYLNARRTLYYLQILTSHDSHTLPPFHTSLKPAFAALQSSNSDFPLRAGIKLVRRPCDTLPAYPIFQPCAKAATPPLPTRSFTSLHLLLMHPAHGSETSRPAARAWVRASGDGDKGKVSVSRRAFWRHGVGAQIPRVQTRFGM
ncbi:hypothetical protein BU26DRAFT_220842 [Trematosphaeria pertusa]|uniref:Uncharacterized protein n=1 Tax=Trematosphaeria pertusa TaxID=390896 RepID=A0A6A6ITW1_9PLEO|nr:uncharacterized protein BU26DRAFT_220842 [Trematosphaeria pertusa]KAF2253322.1 hypothetical protein BU26DRAFT_220842 [Trematosphaeria pertusa]